MRDSDIVPLTPKAVDTLVVLVERCGELVGRSELLRAVWPDVFVEENNLNSNIFMLRRAFGEENYIATIPRRGYRFMANVDVIVVETGNEQEDQPPANGISIVPTQRPKTSIRSLVIFPFKSLTDDGCDGGLGMGLADALITRLSNQRDVVVRPTSAVAKFRGLDQDPISTGRELDVELILEGNIQRACDRIRVTVQLVRVSSGVSIWAEKFDDRFTDIFAFEDAISERIADALSARMFEDELDWDRRAAA